MYNHIPRRKFNLVSCPFDINLLNPHNNLAHLWLTFGYLMDPNELWIPNHRENKCLRIAELLDSEYLQMDEIYKKEQLLPIINKFIIPQIGSIISEYIDEKHFRTILINALFQLQMYIDFTHKLDGRCDKTLFSVYSFAFEPITIFFYITQTSGFQRYCLSSIVGIQQEIKLLTGNYLNRPYLNVTEVILDVHLKEPHYEYMIANGDDDNEILQRNKNALKLKKIEYTTKTKQIMDLVKKYKRT